MALNTQVVDKILQLVREWHPDWTGFDTPSFLEEEVNYKQEAVALAQESLNESEFRRLLTEEAYGEIITRIEKLGHATNQLYLSTPKTGDLRVLYDELLNEGSFCEAMYELLYGEGSSSDRLQRYVDYLNAHQLPNYWTFPTYYLFYIHPNMDMFVKPRSTQDFLSLVGRSDAWQTKPSGDAYAAILQVMQEVWSAFETSGPSDMIDIQSLVWVAANVERERIVPVDRRQEFRELFQEMLGSYIQTEEGQQHVNGYDAHRRVGRQNYEDIVAAADRGEDVTDRVLLDLFPYNDTEANQRKGAWIHLAPTVKGDLRRWFENAGWVRKEDWPHVASAILEFVRRCDRNPNELESACNEYSSSPYSKGFQSGMLTPMLNALRPDDYYLINRKPIQVLNHFTKNDCSQQISDYPATNGAAHKVVEELASDMRQLGVPDMRDADLFDMFCHWLVAVKHFAFREMRYWKIAPGENARQWQECLEDGFIAIGWDDLGDISDISRSDFDARRDGLVDAHPDWTKQALNQVWKFAKHVKEGDRIVANRGTTEVVGIGTVSDSYYYVPDVDYGHRLPVDWEGTTVRKVNEDGWHRTLVKLDQEKFESILNAPPIVYPDYGPEIDTTNVAEEPSDYLVAGACPFKPRTFELLTGIHDKPTKAYYDANKVAFQRYVEKPFKQLFLQVAERLPQIVRDVMESRVRLFSKFLKNDYGKGGAWDFYWGAFYPKGGKRSQAAQLSIWMNYRYLEYGFYIGDYATEQRQRFEQNCRVYGNQLLPIFELMFEDNQQVFGSQDDFEVTSEGEILYHMDRTWQDFLSNPQAASFDVSVIVPKVELLQQSSETLIKLLVDTYEKLFPLILLAEEDDPIPFIVEYLSAIGMLEDEAEEDEVEVNPYDRNDFIERTYLPVDAADDMYDMLHEKRQIILYGPPGTGKTYVAWELAKRLTGSTEPTPDQVEMIQFHPAYGYEDFIEGIRPESRSTGDGRFMVDYPVKQGVFVQFCRSALQRPNLPHIFIIDEINRGNIPRIFGELMLLLEYRDRDIPLPYSGKRFRIPENVYVIGTMNTADRAIALVDFALRRRFHFFAMRADADLFDRWLDDHHIGITYLPTLYRRLAEEAIDDPNFGIGPSHFMEPNLTEQMLQRIWKRSIEPYLEEYYVEQRSLAERWRWDSELMQNIREG